MSNLFLLAAEFVFLFFGIPLLIFYRVLPNLPIPYLLVAALLAFFALRHDPSFDLARIISLRNVASNLPKLFLA